MAYLVWPLLCVGGEARLSQLAMLGLTIHADTKVLDLSCCSGQATQFFIKSSQNVTGLDASTLSLFLKRALQNVPAFILGGSFLWKICFLRTLAELSRLYLY